MGLDEFRGALVMALCAKLVNRGYHHEGIVRAMGTMAGGTVLGGGRVQGTIPPILGNLTMTAQTEGRHAFTQIRGMGRAMAAVTGHALPLGYRLVLDLFLLYVGSNVVMAAKADLPGLTFDEIGLVGAVRTVADEAVALGKGRMGGLGFLGLNQVLVASQAELPLIGRNLEKIGRIPAVGIVAARAFPFGKGQMLTEKALFRLGLFMTGETKSRLLLGQQFLLPRLVGRMAIKAAPFLGGSMGLLGVGGKGRADRF
jgi:hypothetical protein